MKKLIIIIILFSLIGQPIIGQETNNLLKGTNQINHNTGKAAYNLPIHTINEGGISVPIYLQNNMGGIKVDDLGTDVGTGWFKSAGATITRARQGSWPDERNSNSPLLTADFAGETWNYDHFTVGYFQHFSESTYDSDYFSEFRTIDTEPDIFYYNVDGYSGSFIIKINDNKEKEVVFLESTNVKIDFKIEIDYGTLDDDSDDQNHIIGWKIITPNGNSYFLGAYESSEFSKAKTEYTTVATELLFDPHGEFLTPIQRWIEYKYATKWFVSKVQNQDNVVHFYYEDEAFYLRNTRNEHNVFQESSEVEEAFFGQLNNEVNSKRITRIEGKYTEVNFTYDQIRFNVALDEFYPSAETYPRLLSDVEVSSKNSDEVNCLAKYTLSYDYSDEYELGYYSKYFLRDIARSGCLGGSAYTTTFDYYDKQLAAKTWMWGQDFWGFNNGEETNLGLFNIPSFSGDCLAFQGSSPGNQSRDLSFIHARAGTLKSISYPSGSVESFDFEFNSIYGLGIVKEELEQELFDVNSLPNYNECPVMSYDIENFMMDDLHEYQFLTTRNNLCKGAYDENIMNIRVYEIVNNEEIFLNSFGTSLFSKSDIQNKLGLETHTNYHLRFVTEYIPGTLGFNLNAFGNFHVTYNTYPLSYKNWDVGGLRIKSKSINDITTQYQYEFPQDENASSSTIVELNICESCDAEKGSTDDGTCDQDDDVSPYTYLACNGEVTAELFYGGVSDCSLADYGDVELIFSDKPQNHTFSIPLTISNTNTTFSFSDSELIAYGLVKGMFYRVLLRADVNDEASVYIRARITFDNIDIPSEDMASSGVQLIGPVNIGAYNPYPSEMINGACPEGDYFFSNTNANNYFLTSSNSEVVYKSIKETVNKELSGSTVYHFDVNESLINTYLIRNLFNPTMPLISTRKVISHMFLPRDFTLLAKVEAFDSNDDLVSEISYDYYSPNEKLDFFSFRFYYDCGIDHDLKYQIEDYNLYVFDSKLKSVRSTEDGISTVTEYTYIPDLHVGPTSTKSYNLNFPDEFNETSIIYSTELTEYDFLTERNYILPIETKVNNGAGGGSKSRYELVNNKVRLTSSYSYDSDGTNEATSWIKVSENIDFTEDGLVKESWSKTSPLNSIFTYEDGLLVQSKYGLRETNYFYDNLRRKRLTIDPIGVGTYVAELDGFHRVQKTQSGIVADYSNIEAVTFSHLKSQSDRDYVVEIDADEEITTHVSFPSDTYGLGVHSSTSFLDNYGRNYKQTLLQFTQSQNDYTSSTIFNEIGTPTNRCSPGAGGCSFTVFEKSPRHRVEKTRAAGASKFVTYAYGDDVPDIDGKTGYYIKSSVTDENNHTTKSYINITGRKKIVIDALNQRTTYNYNDRGQMVTVTTEDGMQYVYDYDGFGRLEMKTIPLKGSYFYAYDNYEQVYSEILPNGTTLTYDYHPTYNDFLTSITNQDGLVLNTYTPYHSDYLTSWVGTETVQVLDKNTTLSSAFTYDEYGRMDLVSTGFLDGSSSQTDFTYDDLDNIRSEVRIHSPSGGTAKKYEISTRYEYDRGRRLEEVYKTLPKIEAEFLVSRHKYDDRDWEVYKNQGGLFSEIYKYNRRGWLKSINSIIQSYPPQYKPCDESDNEVSCTTKKPPNQDLPLYEQDQPTSDLFSLHLYYDQGNTGLQAPAQYNGNISWMEWRVKGENIQKYSFQYDPINRLEEAKYSAYDLPSCETKNKGAYNVSISDYDAMGNIGGIRRRGLTGYDDSGAPQYDMIDNLTLTYQNGLLEDIVENSLKDKGYKEAAAGAGITYSNGNMTSSTKQGIDLIEYNFLDLPTHVETTQGIVLDFVYDANGNQLQMTKTTSASITVTDYQDGIELVNENLESIYFGEGRAVYNQALAGTQNNPYLEWAISDHLGNVRVRYVDKDKDGAISVVPADDVSSEITGSYHYYPFGMKMEGEWNVQQGNRNKYQYNGIEHIDDIGLSFAMYRVHDPSLGRWMQSDPLAENAYHHSPYNSMWNNPVSYADPDGDFAHILIGAGLGGLVNLGVQAYKGNIDSWGDGFKAFGIGAVAGGVTAATGGLAAGALGLGTTGFISGAVTGGVGAIAGSPIQGIGNAIAFGDEYSWKQYGADILGGAILGGLVSGGIAAWKGQNFWWGNTVRPSVVPNGIEFGDDLGYKGTNSKGQKAVVGVDEPLLFANEHVKGINPGAQSKHIPGSHNYDPNRSQLLADPEQLLKKVYALDYEFVRYNPRGMAVIRFNQPVGIYSSHGTSIGVTNLATMSYQSSTGLVHFIPAWPIP